MAPQSKDAGVSILTPDYVALLQRLCKTTQPSISDVSTTLKLFCAFLGGRNPKRSPVSSSSLSTSSCRAKKRGGKSAARASAVTDNASGGGCGGAGSDIGFERSCTWVPDKKACWIMSNLDMWNHVLCEVCIELREDKWDELTLQAYEWPENKSVVHGALCASLLIHVLLRQHRCVTCVFLDMSVTTVESHVIWHALRTGAGGVKWLECRPYFLGLRSPVTSVDTTTWSQAVAALTNLNILHLHCIHFSKEIARTLGGYVMRSTALSTLQLINIKADDRDAGVFLDCLACNRTVKVLCVQESFLIARQGQALAEVVRDHVTLEKLEVTGSSACIPSALLAAVVQSKTLTALAVHACSIRTEDIEAMASALTLPAPSPACDGENAESCGACPDRRAF
ncbi:uncharacterized protein LOC125940958 [Dermacentor silvarum]|uniref:uncharacterized protein LOC125940958 n=1 Tax=Dermacentor silvarum TaxID=543639 RepID=UPI002101387C|nr:uncharacterized protein LOC125940958 [Dermacentor silvarum]